MWKGTVFLIPTIVPRLVATQNQNRSWRGSIPHSALGNFPRAAGMSPIRLFLDSIESPREGRCLGSREVD